MRLSLVTLAAAFLLAVNAAAAIDPGTNVLLSRPPGALPTGQVAASSLAPPNARTVSDNGRFVVFDSGSDGLSPDDNDGVLNVYVRDRQTDTTTLVSRAADGTPGNGSSSQGSI